jgi:hypothetical protein
MPTSSVRLPPAIHADCSLPKEEVSHTSDNSYHPGVSMSDSRDTWLQIPCTPTHVVALH